MSELCKWLHEQLEKLPLITHPFNLNCLPENGIYFFYEEGEGWGHGGGDPRIVRVGTHRRQGGLPGRIGETYLLDERKLNFSRHSPKPADRSIFRKNLGRALLNRAGDEYPEIWEIDFTTRRHREGFSHLRDIEKEKLLEQSISALLKERFSFRIIPAESQADRARLEKLLVGTVARCAFCSASSRWLGRYSPKEKIREGKLWQVQHLRAGLLGPSEKTAVLRAIKTMRA